MEGNLPGVLPGTTQEWPKSDKKVTKSDEKAAASEGPRIDVYLGGVTQPLRGWVRRRGRGPYLKNSLQKGADYGAENGASHTNLTNLRFRAPRAGAASAGGTENT